MVAHDRLTCYWHRPIGEDDETRRLTIDYRASVWARPSSWQDLLAMVPGHRPLKALELAGEAWEAVSVDDWQDLCRRLPKCLCIVRFLSSSISTRHQLVLLEHQPSLRTLEWVRPKEYLFPLLPKLCPNLQSLTIRHGLLLQDDDCRVLGDWMATLRQVCLLSTKMEPSCHAQLLNCLEASLTLEVADLDLPINAQWRDYLDGCHAVNRVRRVWLEQRQQQAAVARPRSDASRDAKIDTVAHVWREWWQAAQRPVTKWNSEDASSVASDDACKASR